VNDKSNVSGTGPGGSFVAKVVRIFETLTGLVKVGPDESLRDVHRGNQLQTVSRYQRRLARAQAGLYGAGKFRKAQLAGKPGTPKSKHAGGHMKAPAGRVRTHAGRIDVPRGRVYPATLESASWVSPRALRLQHEKTARQRAQEARLAQALATDQNHGVL